MKFCMGLKPSYNHIKDFRYLCYAHNHEPDRHKFDARAARCVFLGYPYGQKGWRAYDLERRRIFTPREVIFYKNNFPFETHPKQEFCLAQIEEPNQLIEVPMLTRSNNEALEFVKPNHNSMPRTEPFDGVISQDPNQTTENEGIQTHGPAHDNETLPSTESSPRNGHAYANEKQPKLENHQNAVITDGSHEQSEGEVTGSTNSFLEDLKGITNLLRGCKIISVMQSRHPTHHLHHLLLQVCSIL